MAGKKKSIKKKVVVVPQDKVELAQFMAKIREAEQKIDAIGNKFNDEILGLALRINALKKKAQARSKPLEDKIDELAKGVFIFATSHREELTDQKKRKTIEFATGDKIKWYFPPPTVEVVDKEGAIKELKRKGLLELIRVTEEVNKELILQDPSKIKDLKHLSVSREEIFAIVLSSMGIELQRGQRKFKKSTLK